MTHEFFLAVREGDLNKVRSLIDSDLSLLWARDRDGNSPIIEAIRARQNGILVHLSMRALQALRYRLIPPEGLYSVLHDFGEAHFYAAEPDMAGLLGSEDPELRHAAISVLTFHWNKRAYRDQLQRLMIRDPAEYVRAIAARGLGHLFTESQDTALTRALLQKLRDNSESGYVRLAAFDALRDLWVAAKPEEEVKSIEKRAQEAVTEAEDLRQARVRSVEDFDTAQNLWGMAWSLRVDWELVDQIERKLPDQQRD